MISSFLLPLNIKEHEFEDKWILYSPLKYRSELLERVITVPKGFITDLASVPRIPFIFSLFGDRAHHESVLHDYLYQTHIVSRKKADKVFYEAMKCRQKNGFIRRCMYWGVRLFGYFAYKTGIDRIKELQKGWTL